MNKLAIVIPQYTEELSQAETTSLHQALRLGRGVDIINVSPERLRHNEDLLDPIFFPDRYFESTHTYSELMLTHKFWESFIGYEYILIYQLDCLLLRDNLLEWCEMGYDYIGAPWLPGFAEEGEQFAAVGNGGFSLRKVSKHLEVFKVMGNVEVIPYPGHEDVAWSQEIPKQLPFINFKVACPEVAKYFAVETGVMLNKKLLKGKYPSGVHAWEKREPNYFKEIICN